jgi:hypothetical protein
VTAAPFDLLVSAAFIVDEPDLMVEEAHVRLGMPLPDPGWLQNWPGWGYKAWWCRLRGSLRSAPTRLEINGPRQIAARDRRAGVTSYMAEMRREQGMRPIKSHAAVVGVWDFDGLERRLEAAGVERYVDPPSRELPYPRTWIGRRGRQDRSGYNSGDDAGLRIEILPLNEIGLPEHRLRPGAEATPAGADGGILRLTRRQFLVEDLERDLEILRRSFGWEAVDRIEAEKERRATLSFNHPNSASIELIEPGPRGPRRAFLDRHGAGPFRIVLGVGDLAAKAADLRRRGTAFAEVDIGGRRIVVKAPRYAALVEFEEVAA